MFDELPALVEPLAADDFLPSERRHRTAGQTNCEAGQGGMGGGGEGTGGCHFSDDLFRGWGGWGGGGTRCKCAVFEIKERAHGHD